MRIDEMKSHTIQDAVEETADIVQQTGAMCYSYVCDVTTKADVDRVAADVMKDVGNVDILVNNAGRSLDCRHYVFKKN